MGNNSAAPVSDAQVRTYLMSMLDLDLTVNSKRYKDETGAVKAYVPDDLIVLFPTGTLGNTWFGTTPEESDLMSSSITNVSIVDTGVAVTTMQRVDPVNVETKVTQICLPSFEQADTVVIADVATE